MKRAIWSTAGGLLVAFVLGAASGSLGTEAYTRHWMRGVVENGPPGQLAARMKQVLLERGFGLSSEQSARLLPILVRENDDMEKLRARLEPEALPIRWRERKEVRALLTLEQRIIYDKDCRAMDEAMGRTPEPP